MAKPSSTDSSTLPRRRSRWKQRLAIGLIVVAALLIVPVAIVQIVLWTDIPRALVAGQIERQLGVQVELSKLNTRWNGRTTLEDLKLRFPLAEEPFVVVPRLEVTHAGLLKILLGQPLRISQASAERATVVVRQERDGGWNIQRLGRGRPGGSAAAASGDRANRPLEIPDLRIGNATVAVIDAQGRHSVVQELTIIGRNEGANAYSVEASLPGRADLLCALNLRTLEHHLALTAQGMDPNIRALVPWWPQPVAVEALWDGRIDGRAVVGRLELRSARVAGNGLAGVMQVRGATDSLVLQPKDVQVRGVAGVADLRLVGGVVRIADGAITFEQVRAAAGRGMAQVDGQWHFAEGSADVTAVWSELALPAGALHSGGMRLGLARRLDGRQALTVKLDNTGTAAGGKWDATLHLQGLGESSDTMQWTLSAEKLDVGIGQIELDLDGLRAVADAEDGRLTLREMSMQQAGLLEGQGAFDLGGERKWWIYILGRRLPVPTYREVDAQVMISAWGEGLDIRLEKIYARAGDLQITGDGYYNQGWDTPLVLQVSAYHPSPAGTSIADAPPLEGGVDAEFCITGQVEPVNLSFTGGVRGRDLRFRRRQVGQINLAVSGTIKPDVVAFETTEADLLGGRWRFWGRAAQTQRSQVLGVHVRELPLAHVAQIVDVDGLAGVFGGDWRITWPQGQQDPRVEGQFEIADLSYKLPLKEEPTNAVVAAEDLPSLEEHLAAQGVEVAPGDERTPIFRAASVSGRTIIADQRLRLEDLLLRQEDGTLRGSASIGLRDTRYLNVKLSLDRWPAVLPGSPGSLRLSGGSDIVIDLVNREIAGPIELITDLLLEGKRVGHFTFDGRFSGRGVDLPNIHAELFGGRAWGRAMFDIDRPLRSTGTLQFNDLQAAEMVAVWPRLEGLSGSFRGMAHLRPAQTPTRPVGPLRLSGYVDPVQPARFRAADLGSASFDLYIDTRSATAVDGVPGGLRIVLDSARLEAFGGVFDLWARYTRHPGGQMSSQSNLSFRDVSLEQVMRTFVPKDDRPLPGVLDGAATIVGNPFDRERAFGEGTVHLAESDLASIESIRLLYDLMNIGTDTTQPTGEGRISLRMEGQTLLLTEMSYFNRGTEVRAVGQFDQIWDMPQAPVQATIVGIGRPFRDLKLPFMADVDDILAALQRNATTVRVSGTVAKPDVRQATFDEIGQTLRSVLSREAMGE